MTVKSCYMTYYKNYKVVSRTNFAIKALIFYCKTVDNFSKNEKQPLKQK